MKYLFYTLIFSLIFFSCDDSSTNSESNDNILKLSSVVLEDNSLPKISAAGEVDSIVVTRVRMLVRNIKFKTPDDSDSLEFKTDPLVIDMNLDGVPNTVGVTDIPDGTYDRAEFRIHKLDPDDPDDQPFVGLPEFSDFMADKRYSILIEGYTYSDGIESTFNFQSRLNEKQRHFLNPNLVIPGSSDTVYVSLVVDKSGWFVDEDSGLLDPAEQNNENDISKNIKESVHILKDKDRNGRSDD